MINTISYPDYSALTVNLSGGVLRIAHNRPEARNAENTRMLDELNDALQRAEADPAVGALIIGGEGPHFSAGHDLKEALTERSHYTVEQRWDYEAEKYFGYALKIWDFPKPTVAEVRGACLGGAFMVANMCDLMVASDDAYFADPVLFSLASASVEVLIHPYVMGLRRAKEFLFTNERMDAAEAYRIGMVSRVVEGDKLQETAMALAAKMAEAPIFGFRLTKRSLNRTLDLQGFRTGLAAHFETHQITHVTAETQALRAKGATSVITRGAKS